jgi:hypothetical protein
MGGMFGAAGIGRPLPDAAAPVPRRRIVFFCTPHGTILDAWRPTADQKFGPILAPLVKHQPRLLILDGIDNISAPSTPTPTHESGPSVLLTAYRGAPINDGGTVAYTAGGPSFDYVYGLRARARTAWIQLGVRTVLVPYKPLALSFLPGGIAPGPQDDPRAVFASFFSNGGPPPPLGLSTINPNDDASIPAIARAQMDILVDTLAYDQTSVVTLSFFDASSTVHLPWLGIDAPYVDVAHQSNGATRQDFIKVQTWFASQFAYLLDQLDMIPDGAETMLDSSLVIWLSETGEASSDSGKNIPVVIAGSWGGQLATGQIQHLTATQADLFQTLAVQTGLAAFGDPALGGKVIPTLLPTK